MAEVTLTNITKQFGDFTAVKDLSMIIEDGKFTVLVGPSGCGKTTTLRMVAGLEEATEGEIRIGERVVNKVPPKDRDIAMVFQNYALYPHMDVFNNMAFGLKLRKFSADEIKERVEEAADILGIEELLQRRPKELSGGQRQRVAVGRAIVRKPSVFLFDEPLSNLDAKLRVQMRTEIKKLHSKLKTTMIYVTHDQVEAMTMGDRIVVLKDGYVMQAEAPLEIYAEPANRFVAGFIGSPAMNFLPVNVRNGADITLENAYLKLEFPLERYPQLKDYTDKEVILGVRPEHLTLSDGTAGLQTTLDVSELMGNESYLYTHAGETEVVARVQDTSPRQPGDAVHLIPQLDRLHFFEPESGERI